jgi:TM2 domain-containing membrane protein YozV
MRRPVSDVAHNLKDTHRRSANTAAVLTWLVPGAGHLFLGRGVLGLVVFAVVEGLYFLGLHLSEGMTFEFLDAELRTVVAPLLAPESGNLGGILWQMKQFGFGTGRMREWPDHIVLGSSLSAASGVLNAVAMAHAHLLARVVRPSEATRPVLSMLLTWICPGLGHVHQGRVVRGVIVFVLLVGSFALGTAFAEGSNLSRERHFYYWAGQFLLGGPALIAEALFGSMRVTRDIPYVEAGLVFGCVAGLLNVLAMIDAFGYGEAKAFGWPLKHHGDRGGDRSDSAKAGAADGAAPKPSEMPKLGEISV